MTSAYRSLPSVEWLLSDERLASLMEAHSRQHVLDIVRDALDDARGAIAAGRTAPKADQIVAVIRERAAAIESGMAAVCDKRDRCDTAYESWTRAIERRRD